MALPAFADVYQEFEPRIRRYLSRLVGPTEAEDLSQEVFARTSRALEGFRGESKLSTWLYRIATNVAIDRLRRPGTDRDDDADVERVTATEGASIDQQLAREEMSECVRGHVDALPPSYRSVLLLSEEEGLPNQQIAEVLGVSLDTVKIRLHRARARLKDSLSRDCSLYRDERNELACEPRPAAVSFRPGPPSTRSRS